MFLPSQLARAGHRAVVLDSPHETLVVTAAANKLRICTAENTQRNNVGQDDKVRDGFHDTWTTRGDTQPKHDPLGPGSAHF